MNKFVSSISSKMNDLRKEFLYAIILGFIFIAMYNVGYDFGKQLVIG